MGREVTIGLTIERDHIEGQALIERERARSKSAVATINDDLKPPRAKVERASDPLSVARDQIIALTELWAREQRPRGDPALSGAEELGDSLA
jgi:hypothetical protein